MTTVCVPLVLLFWTGLTGSVPSRDGHQAAYTLAIAPIRALAIHVEILGAKDTILTAPNRFVSDCDEILRRVHLTARLPAISGSQQFDRESLGHHWMVAKARFQAALRNSYRLSREELAEARFVFEVYDLLHDALCMGDYRVFDRRLMLSRVRLMIGETDFNAGILPRIASTAR